MVVCSVCEREMLTADSCTQTHVEIDGHAARSVRYGDEADWPTTDHCHDCGIEPGGTHHPGCDVERVPPAILDAGVVEHDQVLWHRLGNEVTVNHHTHDGVGE